VAHLRKRESVRFRGPLVTLVRYVEQRLFAFIDNEVAAEVGVEKAKELRAPFEMTLTVEKIFGDF